LNLATRSCGVEEDVDDDDVDDDDAEAAAVTHKGRKAGKTRNTGRLAMPCTAQALRERSERRRTGI
jgi:hypothetical protein